MLVGDEFVFDEFFDDFVYSARSERSYGGDQLERNQFVVLLSHLNGGQDPKVLPSQILDHRHVQFHHDDGAFRCNLGRCTGAG